MADETTPPSEPTGESPEEKIDAPVPEETPVPEEAPMPEEGVEEALIPEEGEEGGEEETPAAEGEEAEKAEGEESEGEESEEEESGGSVSKAGFVVMAVLTLGLTIGGLGYYYVTEFTPGLEKLKKHNEIAHHAAAGNATAQYKLGELFWKAHNATEKHKQAEGALLQAYKWYSLAARTYLEGGDGHGKEDDHGAAAEPKKEVAPDKMLEDGKKHFKDFSKAHTTQERLDKLMRAYKWLSLATKHSAEKAEAEKELEYVKKALLELGGDDLVEQAKHVYNAAIQLTALEKLPVLSPDLLKKARHLVSAHMVKEEKKKHGHDAHWTYEGITGPDHWGALDTKNSQASHGRRQSPINIVRAEARKADFLGPVHLHYNPQSTFEVVNNGHTIQVNVTAPKTGDTAASTISIGDDHYKLLQFHFHWKSEHTFEGKHTAMELHLVHELEAHHNEKDGAAPAAGHHAGGHGSAAQSKLGVIGVMIKDFDATAKKDRPVALGDPSRFIGEIWETLDYLKEGAKKGDGSRLFTMNPSRLLPPEGHRSYYQYRGSLTTPPCTENVLWTVMEEPIYLTTEQIKKFKSLPFFDKIGGKNNRPVQPTNARFVLKYNDQQWGYKGVLGPGNWMRHWPVAETGTRQSPIDLNRTAALGANNGGAFLHRGVEWKYQKSKIEMVNNGHTIQANFKGENNNTLTLGGEQYKLKQFHFHHRSEHLIDGKSAAMEVHLVHEQLANDKKYAVIGVLIKEGEVHHDIEHWWDHLPKPGGHGNGHGDKHEKKEKEEEVHEFNPASLLPPNASRYFQYEGSLTTPPCTENVFWTVMEEPITFSKEQIEAFRKLFPKNNRPIKPQHNRPVIRRIGVAP